MSIAMFNARLFHNLRVHRRLTMIRGQRRLGLATTNSKYKTALAVVIYFAVWFAAGVAIGIARWTQS